MNRLFSAAPLVSIATGALLVALTACGMGEAATA